MNFEKVGCRGKRETKKIQRLLFIGAVHPRLSILKISGQRWLSGVSSKHANFVSLQNRYWIKVQVFNDSV